MRIKTSLLFFSVIISFLSGCSKMTEENDVIFLDYESDRVFINNTEIDESNIKVLDKINGLRLFYDIALNNLWDEQQLENNYFQFHLIYSSSNETTSYEKTFDASFKFSQAAIKYIYNNVAVIRTHDNYLLYNIVDDKYQIVDFKRSGFLGYDGQCLYFTDGYYDLQTNVFCSYFDYKKMSRIAFYNPVKNNIVSTDGNNIAIFDVKTGNTELLKIQVNLKNQKDRRSVFYLYKDKLYYSKYKFSLKSLIPVPGYYYKMNWYEYDLKTKKRKRIQTPSNKCVIIGII